MGNNTLIVIDTNLQSSLAIWLGVDECRRKTEREGTPTCLAENSSHFVLQELKRVLDRVQVSTPDSR
jgi:hypothetical protein